MIGAPRARTRRDAPTLALQPGRGSPRAARSFGRKIFVATFRTLALAAGTRNCSANNIFGFPQRPLLSAWRGSASERVARLGLERVINCAPTGPRMVRVQSPRRRF